MIFLPFNPQVLMEHNYTQREGGAKQGTRACGNRPSRQSPAAEESDDVRMVEIEGVEDSVRDPAPLAPPPRARASAAISF
jgi:hypothetical protein